MGYTYYGQLEEQSEIVVAAAAQIAVEEQLVVATIRNSGPPLYDTLYDTSPTLYDTTLPTCTLRPFERLDTWLPSRGAVIPVIRSRPKWHSKVGPYPTMCRVWRSMRSCCIRCWRECRRRRRRCVPCDVRQVGCSGNQHVLTATI